MIPSRLRSFPRIASASGLTLMAGVGGLLAVLLLTACEKEEAATPSAGVAAAPQTPVQAPASGTTAQEADLSDEEVRTMLGDLGTAAMEPSTIEAQVADLLELHGEKTGTELLQLPEVNRHLVAGLTKLNDRPELKQMLDTTVAVTAELIGLQGEARLDLDMSQYTQDRKTRMLTAVLSEDPKQIVDYVADEIGSALPDLYYGNAERAPNGVAIVPKDTPPQ